MRLPEHKRFFSINGKEAESLSDLRDVIAYMSEEDFKHHTSGKNDFAQWVRDILHQDYMADRLLKVHSREDCLELITDKMNADKQVITKETDEFKRFIVKEFLYGMVLGILIGVMLSWLL